MYLKYHIYIRVYVLTDGKVVKSFTTKMCSKVSFLEYVAVVTYKQYSYSVRKLDNDFRYGRLIGLLKKNYQNSST